MAANRRQVLGDNQVAATSATVAAAAAVQAARSLPSLPSPRCVETNSILDAIQERIINVELFGIGAHIRKLINHSMLQYARQEATLRQSTISIKIDPSLDAASIIKVIHQNWTDTDTPLECCANYPVKIWRNKTMVFCQFVDKRTKVQFLNQVSDYEPLENLSEHTDGTMADATSADNDDDDTFSGYGGDSIMTPVDNDAAAGGVKPNSDNNTNGNKQQDMVSSIRALVKNLVPENQNGHHFTRQQVRMEIPMVRSTVSLEGVVNLLTKLASPRDDMFSDIREGKCHQGSKARSILFKSDASGIRLLFKMFHGVLPFKDDEKDIKCNLYVRLNCKPYVCKLCHSLGKHDCLGKRCPNCGSKQHSGKECKRQTRFCVNCKKPGHRAVDTHCSAYVNEVIKEIRRIDLPLDVIEDQVMRANLIKQITFK